MLKFNLTDKLAARQQYPKKKDTVWQVVQFGIVLYEHHYYKYCRAYINQNSLTKVVIKPKK